MIEINILGQIGLLHLSLITSTSTPIALETRMDYYQTDCDSLWSDMKRLDKELKYKRRWLIGLTTSKSEQDTLTTLNFLQNRSMPESLLRKDDLLYETVKRCVEEAYSDCHQLKQHMIQDNHVVDFPNISRFVSSLDNMTSEGLYHVALILSSCSDRFDNTRSSMKKFIEKSLAKISRNKARYLEISGKFSQLLSNPRYFRQKSATFSTMAYHTQSAAIKIIDGLEDLPTQTLIAMHRKIKGNRGGIPQTNHHKHGWNRNALVNQVRQTCEKMLSELGKGDELQEPLAKAMSVAGLSLKLREGLYGPDVTEFQQLSPEIMTLQNEIAKAIWLMKDKVGYLELEDLLARLDPAAKVSSGCVRAVVKKLLTDYLFECDDMDIIPKSLSETLGVINQSTRIVPYRCFPKENIEEEVEYVLNVSAQTKQIVLDLIPSTEYDQDYASAYMEDLEESDDGDIDDDDNMQRLLLKYSQSRKLQCDDYHLEYVGESTPMNSKPFTSITEGNSSLLHLTLNEKVDRSFVPPSETAVINGAEFVDSPAFPPPSLFQESESLAILLKKDLDQYLVPCNVEYDALRNSRDGTTLHFASEGLINGNADSHRETEGDVNMESNNSQNHSNVLYGQESFVQGEQNICKNKYLAIQEICDAISMVAYRLIGCMMKEFARIDRLNLDLSDKLYLSGNSLIHEDPQGDGIFSRFTISISGLSTKL